MVDTMHQSGDSHRRMIIPRIRMRRLTVMLCTAGLATIVVALYLTDAEPNLYRAVVLPSYGGKPFLPHAINDHGQIVGLIAMATEGHSVGVWDQQHGIQELEIASRGPLAINNYGQIAGTMIDPNGNTSAFIWDPHVGLTRLCSGRVENSGAYAINSKAQVVGSYEADGGRPHACFWRDETELRDLNPPDAHASLAYRINDSAQVFGDYGNGPDHNSCFWDLADPNSLDGMPLPSEGAIYHDMNNRGDVLGDMLRSGNGPNEWPQKYVGLWHKATGWTWLFPLLDINASSYRVNDARQIVYSDTHQSVLTDWLPRRFPPRERLYLWDPICGSVSLDKSLQLGATDRFAVRDLNNEGCIVGVVLSSQDVVKRAVLLEPMSKERRRLRNQRE